MANSKYKFYVIQDNVIVSNGFDNFTDVFKTFFHFFNNINFGYLAIAKLSEPNNFKTLKYTYDVNNSNYIFIRMDSRSGHLEGPISVEDLKKTAEKRFNSYGHNGCNYFCVLKTSFKDAKKLFDII